MSRPHLEENAALHPGRSKFARHHPATYLGIREIIGLIVAVLSGWAFFALADAFPQRGWLTHTDRVVALWLQQHGSEGGETFFWWVSVLGDSVAGITAAILVIVLCVKRLWLRAAALAVTCSGAPLLERLLKLSFHRARPPFASEFVTNGSFSFPSGHALNCMVMYGAFAYWLGVRYPHRRALAWTTAVALIGFIGFARLYLGVHYLSDVLAGFTAGIVWLVVCITSFRLARRRLSPDLNN